MSRSRFLSALLTALLVTFTATACRKSAFRTSTMSAVPDTLVTGTIINSAGNWSANIPNGSRHLEVTVGGNSISWSVETRESHLGGGSSRGASSSSINLSAPSDPWFIFVESPMRLWFFNGKDELNYSLSDGGGSRGGPAIFSGRLQPTTEVIPQELVSHLPADLQKLLPPVKPAEKRPSL